MSDIHTRLKSFRQTLELTQSQMADLVESSLRQYRRYESGEISIPSEKLVPLAVSHNLDLNWLFTGEGTMLRSRRADTGEEARGGLEILESLLQEYRARIPDHQLPQTVRDIGRAYTPDEEEILQALITLICALYRI